MKKHNENDGGARDLDALLGKLKERHDARERSGIYASEEEFKRRFFQAARAQERPHFPMIWKAAAGIAVCLLAFQLVLTTLKDDSSAVRADNYGVPGIDMPVDGYAAAGYAAAAPEKASDDAVEARLLDRLDEAIAHLPKLYRESLSAGVLSGLSPEEAAAMLGCSRNTLYQRIHKAKQLLAKSIREVSYEEA